ncbi:methyltransferase, FkbM family [Marininema mesophilum]|uniref:Methyltransferase, FkbM family n=1 Tax=Marininema mesophilum TaxID=1048340 RepID=A0A1H2THI5_9BACL|nr:FkbM family methyltransferase [Marininema mesophilum]SDW43423.1 methyltransferase, FkbM family [Marininema mesophilum]
MKPKIVSISKRNAHFNVLFHPKNSWIWNDIHRNNWEEYTFDIFDRFLSSDHTYLDIGAWIGPTVLYAAQIAKHVYAVEPDPVAFGELTTNFSLNSAISSRITLINSALSTKTGMTHLYSRHSFGDSVSSLIPTISDQSCIVECITIADLIRKYSIKDLNFVKIDIEGGEYLLIPHLREFLETEKPTLYLSLHPLFLKQNISRKCRDKTEIRNYFNKITKNMIDSLHMYKYKYDNYGNIIEDEVLLGREQNGEFIFTNERW